MRKLLTCIYCITISIFDSPYLRAQNVTVNPGAGNYATLKEAFDAINAGTHTGVISIGITGNTTEIASAVLNASGTGSANYTSIGIAPSGGAARTISGSVTTGAVIDFAGADNVTLDGLNLGGNSLILRNTSATTGAVIRFISDATNNTVTGCTIEGQNSSTSSGLIIFSTSVLTLGNSNNFITNNTLRDRTDAGAPFAAQINCIYSSGTSGAPNSANTITGNNFQNFATNGINLTATGIGNSWIISNNSFFNDRATQPITTQNGMLISGGSSHTISGNHIGGQIPMSGGSAWINAGNANVTAINLANVGSAGAVSVQGNTIRNINLTITSSAILNGITISGTSTVNLGTVTGNTIGDPGVANSLQNAGANSTTGINSTSAGTVNISNNTVANITATNTSINILRGIAHTGAGSLTIMNNIVQNLNGVSAQTSSNTSAIIGIYSSSTSPGQLIKGNTINSLYLNNTGSVMNYTQAICVNSANITAGTISENKIYDLQNKSTGSGGILGIHLFSGSWNIINNMVSVSNGSNTNGTLIFGIRDAPGTGYTSNIYHNTLSISGTPTGLALGTYGFEREGGGVTDIKNNIFVNTRTGTSAAHYAIGERTTVPGAGLTSNYNDLYSANPATLGDWNNSQQTFAGWKTISGGDANSVNILPVFVSQTDLHLVPASNAALENLAPRLATVLTDIDAEPRNAMTDMGADEFSIVLPVSFISLKAYQKQNGIQLEWKVAAEINLKHYEVEHSVDGRIFRKAAVINPRGNNNSQVVYDWFDNNSARGNNYYRIRLVYKNANEFLTSIIRVFIGQGPGTVTIYPNPVKNDLLSLSLNNIPKDNYSIQISNHAGQIISAETIEHQGGSAGYNVNLKNILVRGVYYLSLMGKYQLWTKKVIKE